MAGGHEPATRLPSIMHAGLSAAAAATPRFSVRILKEINGSPDSPKSRYAPFRVIDEFMLIWPDFACVLMGNSELQSVFVANRDKPC